VYWVDGYSRPVEVWDTGQCSLIRPGVVKACWPKFSTPYFKERPNGIAEWNQQTFTGLSDGDGCTNFGAPNDNWHRHQCGTRAALCTTPGIDGTCPLGGYPDEFGLCCSADSGCTETYTIACDAYLPDSPCTYFIDKTNCLPSPLLIDVKGDGFDLTDAAHGVNFDIDGNPDRQRERLSWTRAGSDDAWLFFDRNENGIVDSGRELFGNFTAQQTAPNPPNGFNALARFDMPDRGGNSDGVIDRQDIVFAHLRLWQDVNHNGISEQEELRALTELGVFSISLDYRESKRADQYGNQFRYRARVTDEKGEKVGRWAWDVFLTTP
ncbi:MAG: hypothetical protein LC731_01050, partial [Acidobacteria bacterium]|nr:hypothetical protein [Acidobacteriota bacterium]